MGVLIGYVDKGKVIMATDTRTIIDDRKYNETCECNYKVQKCDNGILVGIVDNRNLRQLVLSNREIFTLNKNGKLTKEHIVTEIVPKLYSLLKENDLITYYDDKPPIMRATILLAYKYSLFEICCCFEVCRYEKHQAVGYYSDMALAKVIDVDTNRNIDEQLVKALKNCSEFTEYVASPFITIDTESLKYKVWEE
ncbi:MAG: hypothetical protein KBS91_02290 [Firmicutes bacterium]|nr:hypothetical protein [Candidatus Caballimonas caccae]